jgi:hypothetical protein
LIRSGGFRFSLGERAQLRLRLDDSPPVLSLVAVIGQGQITSESGAMQILFPLLLGSKRLTAALAEASGTAHNYSFSLQPNDLALRDIDVHCFKPGA